MTWCLLYIFTITISYITAANSVKILLRLMDFWFFNLSLYVLVVAAFATYLIIDTKVILQINIFHIRNKHFRETSSHIEMYDVDFCRL